MTPGTSQRERLTALIEPVVVAAGYDLEEIGVTAAGRRSQVRVVVDSEHGVSLDEVAELSRTVSALLDEHDAVMGASPYVLEVTSPGVDRPLTQPRHWRRAVGRLVAVPVGGQTVEGRVLRVDGNGVVLAHGEAERAFGYDELGPGRVQIEFNRSDDRAR